MSQVVPGVAGGGAAAKRSGPFSPTGCSRSRGSPGTPAPALLFFLPPPLGSPWVGMVMGRPRGPWGRGHHLALVSCSLLGPWQLLRPAVQASLRALSAWPCSSVLFPCHTLPGRGLIPRAGVPCAERRW